MFTIIGADGKEYGPVATDKVRDWIAGGRANLQTRARREGEPDWKTLADFAEFAAAQAAPPVAGAAPAPAAPAFAGPVDARTYAADLIARSVPIDIFECLSRGFKLWTSNFWPLVGVTLLVMAVQFIAGMVPILGMLSSFLLNGVFYGGLYYYYIGKVRGEPRQVGDAFAGFSKAFVPLMVATLLTTLITMAVIVPCFFPLIGVFVQMAVQGSQGVNSLPSLTLSGFALTAIFIGTIVVIYLSISWIFAFALVIDKGLGPWTAMEVSRRVVGRQWFRVFFLMFFGAILASLGLIALFIGVFFTMPLAICALISAYEEICNPPAKS